MRVELGSAFVTFFDDGDVGDDGDDRDDCGDWTDG
jgi:hypothetical protein